MSFFNQLKTCKRLRTSTISDFTSFNKDKALFKILNFIVDNNLSFNILNSDFFKDLLNYYNKFNLVINRWKIKGILDKTYKKALNTLVYKLKDYINNYSFFSVTLDI